MTADTLAAVMQALGLAGYVPVLLAIVGLFSAVSTVYPATWPGAAIVHKGALLIGKASPAVPAAPAAKSLPLSMLAVLIGVGLLSACSAAQLAKVQTEASAAAVQGQLYCAKVTQDGPLVVALLDAGGAPVIATGAAQAFVYDACAAINAIPVSSPANPASAPQVAAVIPAQ